MKLRYQLLFLISCTVAFAAQQKNPVLPISLIPTSNLESLGLCPLYPRYEEFTVDNETFKNILPVKFKRTGSWDVQVVDKENALKLMPCVKQGKDFDKDPLAKKLPSLSGSITRRIIMQLKTVNQNETQEGTAMCAGLSLRNALLLYQFARTGKTSFLAQLPDSTDAKKFLEKNGCVRWVNAETLAGLIEKVGGSRDYFSVIPTVFLLDPTYYKEPLLAFSFEDSDFNAMKKLREKISSGLRGEHFFHVFIIGDHEVAQRSSGRGHYFVLALLKVGTTVEYVVVDTQVEDYHLRQGSYEYQRLLYFISLLESERFDFKSKLMDLYSDTPYKKD